MTPAAVAEREHAGVLPLWPGEDESAAGGAGDPGSSGTATAAVLGDVVGTAWSSLAAGFTAECLMCGGTVHPRWSAGAGVVGGRCSGCGTEIE